jgi:imidazolonepropionase-like amidohydrolase
LAAGCDKPADDNGLNGSIPFDSRYEGLAARTTLIAGATILTGTGERLDNADLLLVDGKIAEIGTGLSATGADLIDAEGKWVTPGVIDVHSHLGVYASPGTQSHSDGNEATAPVTAPT